MSVTEGASKEDIAAHPFNHAVRLVGIALTQCDLVVPRVDGISETSWRSLLSDLRCVLDGAGSGPCIMRVPLTLFLDPAFSASYIRSGSCQVNVHLCRLPYCIVHVAHRQRGRCVH